VKLGIKDGKLFHRDKKRNPSRALAFLVFLPTSQGFFSVSLDFISLIVLFTSGYITPARLYHQDGKQHSRCWHIFTRIKIPK